MKQIYKKKQAIKCDKCGNTFISGNDKDGMPNGLGFVMQDRKVINICSKCIMELGRLKEAGDEESIKSFWRDLGVEV